MYLFFMFLMFTSVKGFKHIVVTNQPNHKNLINLSNSVGGGITLLNTGPQKYHHSLKLKFVYDFVKTVDSNEIILTTDGFDVIMINSYTNIINKFIQITNNTSTRIIISAEKGNWPEGANDDNIFINKNDIFPYPNGGGYIGYAGDLKKIFEISDCPYGMDDQLWLCNRYRDTMNNKTLPQIKLDSQNEIFISMHLTFEDELINYDNIFKHKNTFGNPKIVHFNGDKKPFDKYYKQLSKRFKIYNKIIDC